MLTHYYTLRALVGEIGLRIVRNGIAEIYSQEKDEVVIGVIGLSGGAGGTASLVISLGTGRNALFLDPGRRRAKKNTATLFREAAGAVIESVEAVPFDRIVVLELSGGMRFIIHLFDNPSSNLFLVDAAGTIRSAFRDSKTHAGRPYDARPEGDPAGRAGKFPFVETICGATGTVSDALKKTVPYLGKTYSQEVLRRGGVDPGMPAGDLTASQAARLEAVVGELNASALRPTPEIFADKNETEIFSVVPLGTGVGTPAGSINDAVMRLHRKRMSHAVSSGMKKSLEQRLAAERKKAERTVGARPRDKDAAAGSRRAGDLIIANIHLLKKGMKEAVFDDGGRSVRIALIPALTPAANAEKYFSDVRKAVTEAEEQSARRDSAAERLRLLDRLEVELSEAESPGELEAFEKKLAVVAPPRQGSGDQVRLPYKEFDLGGGYTALVGRSAADNDELTMKYARPHDWWLHARGASGSHVVVRNHRKEKQVPREILMKAARLAAFYSKMKKASNVPVAYCERKYVRKKKGSPPGTVTLTREEIAFVTPGLPAPIGGKAPGSG